jgi:HK97 family phage major capsid protein
MAFQVQLPERPTVEQVRSALLGAGEYLHGLQSASERGDGWQNDVRSAVQFINQYDSVLTALERGSAAAHQGGAETLEPLANPGYRSLGAMVLEDSAYGDLVARRGAANATHADVEVRGSLFSHNQLFRLIDSQENLTGGAGALLPQGQPIPPVPRQMRLFLRDVLNVQETGLASVPYVREYTPAATELGASAVAEGAAKPEVELLWEAADAPVRKIAAWVPVTSEIIEDAPTLRGYIDGRLGYLLAVREEQQILNGSGSSPQLRGILNTTGVQNQTFTTDRAVTLGLAIGKVEAVDGDVDGIVMHPTDYWAMITTRSATQFDGGFGAGAPFTTPGQGIWGVPVIRSRARPAGNAVVGAWRLGATLFDRMQTTIRVGNQHSDYFTTNKVAILAEERVALAVHRPDFYCTAAFS